MARRRGSDRVTSPIEGVFKFSGSPQNDPQSSLYGIPIRADPLGTQFPLVFDQTLSDFRQTRPTPTKLGPIRPTPVCFHKCWASSSHLGQLSDTLGPTHAEFDQICSMPGQICSNSTRVRPNLADVGQMFACGVPRPSCIGLGGVDVSMMPDTIIPARYWVTAGSSCRAYCVRGLPKKHVCDARGVDALARSHPGLRPLACISLIGQHGCCRLASCICKR